MQIPGLSSLGGGGSPLGGFTTSTYQANKALLDFQIQQAVNAVMQQLGYTGSTGQHIMGSVETDAAFQQADLQQQRKQAIEDITNSARARGTFFSGRRPTLQARAEYPFISSLAQLGTTTARTISDLYRQLSDLQQEKQIRTSMLLADAARERASMLQSQIGNFGG